MLCDAESLQLKCLGLRAVKYGLAPASKEVQQVMGTEFFFCMGESLVPAAFRGDYAVSQQILKQLKHMSSSREVLHLLPGSVPTSRDHHRRRE